jgi:hypothetical protein
MRRSLVIYIYDFVPDPLNFQIYEGNFIFIFYQCIIQSLIAEILTSGCCSLLCFAFIVSTIVAITVLVHGRLKREGIGPVIINTSNV